MEIPMFYPSGHTRLLFCRSDFRMPDGAAVGAVEAAIGNSGLGKTEDNGMLG